jgi:hypothetical protein
LIAIEHLEKIAVGVIDLIYFIWGHHALVGRGSRKDRVKSRRKLLCEGFESRIVTHFIV